MATFNNSGDFRGATLVQGDSITVTGSTLGGHLPDDAARGELQALLENLRRELAALAPDQAQPVAAQAQDLLNAPPARWAGAGRALMGAADKLIEVAPKAVDAAAKVVDFIGRFGS
ncbi:MAG: hypothetical protein HQL42_08660 [Alphaproteobacteria bacterium]|nr:hypothetical protein [Alphaproteobacteria bacterium]